MPITYRIDREAGLLLARVHDPTTLADVRSYVAASVADPAYTPQLVELVDVSGLVEPEGAANMFDAARLLTDLWARMAAGQRVRARGWIALTDRLYALAREYQRQTADAGVPTRVFRDARAAERWARRIAAQPGAPPPS